jgi:hypothetical protein
MSYLVSSLSSGGDKYCDDSPRGLGRKVSLGEDTSFPCRSEECLMLFPALDGVSAYRYERIQCSYIRKGSEDGSIRW